MHLFERRVARGEPFFPAFFMLSVTNQCQLRCPGCWVEQTRPVNSLTRSQLDGIVTTARKYGSSFFGILGGEPLLHSELMAFFQAYPRAYFQLFTNGLTLDDTTACRLAELGNVSPLISLEGLAEGTRTRRGSEKIFDAALAAVQASVRARLFTGVASSISRSNFDELVCEEHIERLVALGVHYVWYYIYRPVGGEPCTEETLTREQITVLRKFIVEQRTKAKLLVIDAYWDADGHAVCPGAMGMSHHIAPDGAIEFCPPLQFASGHLNADASNLEEILQSHAYLRDLRSFTAGHSRGCILLDDPNALHGFLSGKLKIRAEGMENSTRLFDTTHRGDGLAELVAMQSRPDHHDPANVIPDKSFLYRFAKRKYFFGFGAYG